MFFSVHSGPSVLSEKRHSKEGKSKGLSLVKKMILERTRAVFCLVTLLPSAAGISVRKQICLVPLSMGYDCALRLPDAWYSDVTRSAPKS